MPKETKWQIEMAEEFNCLNALIKKEKESLYLRLKKLEVIKRYCIKREKIPATIVIYSNYEDFCLEEKVPQDEIMNIHEWNKLIQYIDDYLNDSRED